MTTAPQQATSHTSRVAGYLLALSAGATWGTTGPLSTGLYRLMPATSIGFLRVLIGTVCLALWGLAFRREIFRVDGRGWVPVGVAGCLVVARGRPGRRVGGGGELAVLRRGQADRGRARGCRRHDRARRGDAPGARDVQSATQRAGLARVVHGGGRSRGRLPE